MRHIAVLSFFVLVAAVFETRATHLRAGDMTAEFVSGYTWRFYLTVYTNIEAITSTNNQLDLLYADIYVNGVKVDSVRRNNRSVVGDFAETYKNDFVFTYTFAGPRVYVVSFIEENRNNEIRNIDGGISDPYPFYIETYVLVSSLSANANNTPVLHVPPLDKASVGVVFVHNAGAFDVDGDSLSYKLVVPKQSATLDVPRYQFMNGLSLNPVTGDLVWDRPREEGLYNVAFLIEEWRNGIRIGFVLRDMQIAVEKTENRPPVLKVPNDTCVVANAELKGWVSATDPDNDRINLRSYSGVYSLGSASAGFALENPNPQSNPAAGEFIWKTTCALVRKEPYQVVFKAEDLPPNKEQLFDLKTWNIKLLAPTMHNLLAEELQSAVRLSWDQYACPGIGNGVIEIYRKQCDSIDYDIALCERMEPADFGFQKIAQVSLDHTSYMDDDQGKGLAQGNYYCYVLKAKFSGQKGGESAFSEQVCAAPDNRAPIPVKASILGSDPVNGKIQLAWLCLLNLDTSIYKAPYTYRIKRGAGLFPEKTMEEIAKISALEDTFYLDEGLNSLVPWHYSVELFAGEVKVAESPVFSTLELTIVPGSESVSLAWNHQVPWKTEPYGYTIYKRKVGESQYAMIKSGEMGSYTDSNLNREDTLCYYVEAIGSYCLDSLKRFLINNRSPEICVTPVDSSAPCPPRLFLDPLACAPVEETSNSLSWIPDLEEPCNPGIAYYNLYFSPRVNAEADWLASLNELTFIHMDSTSLAGCYEVTAVSSYQVESARSNRICTDICARYALPNLFTPNGDGSNDIFRPLRGMVNTEKVLFTVYNRWGSELYRYEGDPLILWDGRNLGGEPLSDGVYFYSARVTFRRRLNPEDDIMDLKGWIRLLGQISGNTEDR